MTMQQPQEPDMQTVKAAYEAVMAIEQKRLAAGYEMQDILELFAVKETGTSPQSIRDWLAEQESETTYETIRHRLNDPKANAILADIESARKTNKDSPIVWPDSLEDCKRILSYVVRHARNDLSDKEVGDEMFGWVIALNLDL